MYAIVTDVHFDGLHRVIGVDVLKEDMTFQNHLMRTNEVTDRLIENRHTMTSSDFAISIANVVTKGVYQLDILTP